MGTRVCDCSHGNKIIVVIIQTAVHVILVIKLRTITFLFPKNSFPRYSRKNMPCAGIQSDYVEKIGVSGLIAVGKTTLAIDISETLGSRIQKEPVEKNPFLQDFYTDKKKYSFPAQISFLNARYKQ